MGNHKTPLKELVERNKPNSLDGLYGWREFVSIAKLPIGKRPSYKSMSRIFGKSDNTMKAWLKRWDKGEIE